MLDIIDAGHKSYYDDVLRCKNPESTELCVLLWFKGWDTAEAEHRLFTENQLLKCENKELFIERAEALEEGMFLKEDLFNLREQVKTERSATVALTLDTEASRVDRYNRISGLITYIKDAGRFSLRREKIISELELLLS